MSNISFIIEGSEADDIALELENYLHSECGIEVKKEIKNSKYFSKNSQSKAFDMTFDNSILLLEVIAVYSQGKTAVDITILLKQVVRFVIKGDYRGIQLDYNGTLYPVTMETVDSITKKD